MRLPDSLKNALNLTTSSAAIVINVKPSGPADRAGILIGDVSIAIDDRPIRDIGDVQLCLGSDSVGKTLNVQVIRGGASLEIPVTIGERNGRAE